MASVLQAFLKGYGRAQAQDEGVKGKVSLTLKGGLETTVNGDLHEGGSGTVLALPTSVDAKSWNDVYGAFGVVRFGGGLGYGVSENVEIIGNVSYGRGSAVGVSKLRWLSVPGMVVTASLKPASAASPCSRGVTVPPKP